MYIERTCAKSYSVNYWCFANYRAQEKFKTRPSYFKNKITEPYTNRKNDYAEEIRSDTTSFKKKFGTN